MFPSSLRLYGASRKLDYVSVDTTHRATSESPLEVVVYREMCRRGYEVTIGRVKEREVDFVCNKGADRLYVQVAYLMPTQETRDREFGALMSVPDQYDKLVLSMDRFDFSAEGIHHRYLPEFLVDSRLS